jgi:putative transposase
MPSRKVQLMKDEIYHIYDRSIAEFKIFNSNDDYERMRDAFLFYSTGKQACNFSFFRKCKKKSILPIEPLKDSSNRIVDIIAYCLMPTHIHLILKENSDGGVSKFMGSVLQSYSRYFNIRHNRKGPLWESRFNNVLVQNDEQFIHLTRYIHLNPVTAYIVNEPQNWGYSSYKEYLGLVDDSEKICSFSDYLTMNAKSYTDFVNGQIDYQRTIALAKTIH